MSIVRGMSVRRYQKIGRAALAAKPTRILSNASVPQTAFSIARSIKRFIASEAYQSRSPGDQFKSLPPVVARVLDFYPDLTPDSIVKRLEYSTFVNFERRYLYFEVPKAACTTMKAYLHQLEDLPPIAPPGEFDLPRRGEGFHNRSLFQMKSILDFDESRQREILESPDFLRFTIVRNPYSRLASAWQDKIQYCQTGFLFVYEELRGRPPRSIQDAISFPEFVDYVAQQDLDTCEPHWRRQASHLFQPALDFNWVGRVEQIAATFDKLRNHLGMPHFPDPPRSNRSYGDPGYDPDTANKTFGAFAPDFKAFDYASDSWKSLRQRTQQTVPLDFYREEVMLRNVQIEQLDRMRVKLLSTRQSRH